MPTFRDTFTTPYDQYAEREGQPFIVVREITEPDDDHDEEVLPMYVIRFPDGETITAWPEEVTGKLRVTAYDQAGQPCNFVHETG